MKTKIKMNKEKTLKNMDRVDEIKIIIRHLKNDVIEASQKDSRLFTETIVKNGRLIDEYKKELKELQNKDKYE